MLLLIFQICWWALHLPLASTFCLRWFPDQFWFEGWPNQNFKIRHKHLDDSFLQVVRSTKQHISCTFVNSEGYIITPHDKIKDIESLVNFIPSLEVPLIRRSYSPEVLFNISKNIERKIATKNQALQFISSQKKKSWPFEPAILTI